MYDRNSIMTMEDAASDFPGIARAPAAVLVRLQEAKGRVVSFDDLAYAIENVTGNSWALNNVGSPVSRARRAIIGKGRIISASGIGYRVEWI